MNTLKKNLPLMIAFLLGAVITYLFMSLQQMRNELWAAKDKLEKVSSPIDEHSAKDKHWMDELIEKQSLETEKRIKEQQAEGDSFKNQFDQFAD